MRIRELLEGRNHPIIVVDVQPEYSGVMDGDENPVFTQIIQFVNNQTGPVLFFVNGEDTGLTGDTIDGIKQYWEDTICQTDYESIQEPYDLDDEDDYQDYDECDNPINWSRFEIVDKGFGFFRGLMDNGVPENVIIRIIRTMYQQGVNDSRELFGGDDPDYYNNMMNLGLDVEDHPDPVITEWTSVAQLKKYSGAYIMGGGRHECLREVEILMNAFNIKYKRIDQLVYG